MILIPVTLIAILYYLLGKKLGKNPIVWAFAGIGLQITVLPLALPFVMFFKGRGIGLIIWTSFCLLGWIISVVVAFIIARRNKVSLFNFKTTT